MFSNTQICARCRQPQPRALQLLPLPASASAGVVVAERPKLLHILTQLVQHVLQSCQGLSMNSQSLQETEGIFSSFMRLLEQPNVHLGCAACPRPSRHPALLAHLQLRRRQSQAASRQRRQAAARRGAAAAGQVREVQVDGLQQAQRRGVQLFFLGAEVGCIFVDTCKQSGGGDAAGGRRVGTCCRRACGQHGLTPGTWARQGYCQAGVAARTPTCSAARRREGVGQHGCPLIPLCHAQQHVQDAQLHAEVGWDDTQRVGRQSKRQRHISEHG